ncbi:MAG TPA: ATP-grasp domain-containing protein [Streptosporangiaceae bacterium]|nr:ATP-grasp domain-containing protein [Streptosporangiaceae bacterium]
MTAGDVRRAPDAPELGPRPRVLLTGYSTDLVKALDSLLPPASLVVLEEKEIFERRGLYKAETAACVERVVFADYIQANDYRHAITTEALERSFDAVFTGTEYTVPAAADLAEMFGLPGASRSAAGCFATKVELRSAAGAGGVAGPRWAEVHSLADLERFAADCDTDIVLKPADRAGSYGVRFLGVGTPLGPAWEALCQAPPDPMSCDRPLEHRYIAEQRMRGPEYSVEFLVSAGVPVFTNVTGKQVWPGDSPVERGHDVPAPIAQETAHALLAAMRTLVAATGFQTGILHGEWILTADGPALVECAARAPGDLIVGLIDLAYGIDTVKALLDLYLGQPADLPSRPVTNAAIRFLHARPGTVRQVRGVTEASGLPGVHSVAVTASQGSEVRPLTSSWDRIGYVLATGQEAGAVAERGAGMVEVVTE